MAFPIDSTEWRKISIAWRDFVPVLSSGDIKPLDPKTGNAPSKLVTMAFGKWWFWKDYAAHSYTIDDLRLETVIELDTKDYTPAGAPPARVLQKLKDKKQITLVSTGDSLSDPAHWANREILWQTLLAQMIKDKYGVEMTIVNPAIGGTELLQGLVIIPRRQKQAPAADLVTICYGGNDLASGITAEKMRAVQKDAVVRYRRATKGAADILIMTTAPGLTTVEKTAPITEAGRRRCKCRPRRHLRPFRRGPPGGQRETVCHPAGHHAMRRCPHGEDGPRNHRPGRPGRDRERRRKRSGRRHQTLTVLPAIPRRPDHMLCAGPAP